MGVAGRRPGQLLRVLIEDPLSGAVGAWVLSGLAWMQAHATAEEAARQQS